MSKSQQSLGQEQSSILLRVKDILYELRVSNSPYTYVFFTRILGVLSLVFLIIFVSKYIALILLYYIYKFDSHVDETFKKSPHKLFTEYSLSKLQTKLFGTKNTPMEIVEGEVLMHPKLTEGEASEIKKQLPEEAKGDI